MVEGQKYGECLPDQVDFISNLSQAQLELLSDVREIYKDRIALEREYSGKLQALAKKASEKKSKKEAVLVLGNEPTKAWDESTIRQSTVDQAYTQLISSMSDSAQDHEKLADGLNAQVADALKGVEKKYDETYKKQMQFYQKLLSDRDKVYSEHTKCKQKYDEECMEVETYRQKQDRASDDRHADRAAKQYEQQQVDMLNSKNIYLIQIAVANKTKAKFYNEDLPELENQFQTLQTSLLQHLTTLLTTAQSLHTAHLTSLQSHVTKTQDTVNAVEPQRDQDIYIDWNIRPFSAPADWAFEECKSHYDTGDISVEPAPKVYLQNRLGKCRGKLSELTPLVQQKRSEVEKLEGLVRAYTQDGKLGNVNDVADDYLEAHHQLVFYENSECIIRAEIDTIVAALAGDEGGQSPHQFKSSSFSIPTQCGYCKSSIWGLSKQGKTCKRCGLSVHSKCEMKVPADCSGSKSKNRSSNGVPSSRLSIDSTLSRSSSVVSKASTPTPSSFVQSETASRTSETYPKAKVVFDFSPTSPFELAVSDGDIVHVLEDDDGSGWVKVVDARGGKGLVPASYIEADDDEQEAAPVTPVVRPRGSGKHVRGIYDYQAGGPDEISVTAGGLIELTGGPSGGMNYADGWWEGLDSQGRKGIFPSNYVEPV